MKLLRVLAIILVGIVATYFGVALALIYWPASVFDKGPKITPEQFIAGQLATGIDFEQPYAFEERSFTARDGTALYARVFDAPDARATIILVHGVASESLRLNRAAGLIREACGARVITLDLRGHGRSGGKPWSVTHAGQYEEDISDVVAALRGETQGGRIVLAGHSMGGGIALRYALKPAAPPVNGYLLIAPLLGGDSPTMPNAAAGPAPAGPDNVSNVLYFRTPRLFGVLAFNIVGITAFDQLPILYFNHPPKMPAYGFAALSSMQPNVPQDYRVALGAIRVPLLVIAGSRDEAFRAEHYQKVIAQYGRGDVVIIDGESHNRILQSPAAMDAIKAWAASL